MLTTAANWPLLVTQVSKSDSTGISAEESETMLQHPEESYIVKSRTSTSLSKSSSKSSMIGPEVSW